MARALVVRVKICKEKQFLRRETESEKETTFAFLVRKAIVVQSVRNVEKKQAQKMIFNMFSGSKN